MRVRRAPPLRRFSVMKNCLKRSFISCSGVHGRCWRKAGPRTVAVHDRNPMRAAGGGFDSLSSAEQTAPKVVGDEELNKPRTEGSPVRGAEDTVHDRRVPGRPGVQACPGAAAPPSIVAVG